MFAIVFYVILPIVGLTILIRWGLKKSNSLKVDQRLEDIKTDEETYDKIKYVDKDEAKRKGRAINDFMEETQD
jgi:hypothetical protein